MIEPTESLEELDRLVECYVVERRNRRCNSIEEFVGRQHPQWQESLRELLPAVSIVEPTDDLPNLRERTPFPTIPNYRFSRILGRGGMGIVYQAEHIALGRQVAVKVLSDHLIQDKKAKEFFLREARAAARMHHTNIVPVFEVGHHQEIVFYSMQLIAGKNLDEQILEWRNSNQSNNRGDLNHRHFQKVAELGKSIARGLQFAHEHHVLHRDIKPSNILIDNDGTAWLSDFGLASIADEQVVLSEDLMGTLRYLAPERLQGTCDARSDIYSLGLTLYEAILLAPALGALQRCDLVNPNRTVAPIQQVIPDLPVDLATIIDKTLRNEPEARYASAEELANDLQCYLDGNPISARAVSKVERLWMWGKRNPALAVSIASFNFMLLVVAIGSFITAMKMRQLNKIAEVASRNAMDAKEEATANATEARTQAAAARTNEEVAKHVSSYFAKMIQGADPSGLFTGHGRSEFSVDRTTTAFEWIAQSAKHLDREDFSDAPLVEAELRDTLGVALTGQMRMDDALPLLKRALQIRSESLGSDSPDVAKSLDHLGSFYFYSGDPQAAREYYSKSLAISESNLGHLIASSDSEPSTKSTATIQKLKLAQSRTQSALGLSIAYSSFHESTTAVELLRQSLLSRIDQLGENHIEVAYCHIALASVLARNLQHQDAMEEISKAERILIQSVGDHRLTEVFSLYAQGTALQSARMIDLAIDRFSKAESMMTELFGPSHPLTVYARGEIAGAMERGGHPEKAEAIYKKVIEFNQEAMSKQPFLGQSWDTLGVCYRGQNKFTEAIDAFEHALKVYQQAGLEDQHVLVALTKKRLADCLVIAGRVEEGYAMLTSATEALALLPGDASRMDLATGLSYRSYLSLWHQTDKFPEIVAMVVRVGKEESDPRVIEHLMNAGTRGRCHPQEAKILLEMNDRWSAIAKDEYSQLEANHFRGRVLWQLGRYDEAIECFQRKQRCERREYQARLFTSLCVAEKGDLPRAEHMYLDAVNQVIPRLPVLFANNLLAKTTDRLTAKPSEQDPSNPIEFHWEQSAYAEFVWRLLHEGAGNK